MASKARKERRRLERERLAAQNASYETSSQSTDRTTASLQPGVQDGLAATQTGGEDDGEQAGKEAYSGLVEVVRRDRPPVVERMKVETERYGATYEEANWAKLSPTFRETHNRLRQLRGMAPIPPPVVDLYRPPLVKRADPKEIEALDREQLTAKSQFLGQQRHMAPGREGFTINGEPFKW
jgi:hypothetical protein